MDYFALEKHIESTFKPCSSAGREVVLRTFVGRGFKSHQGLYKQTGEFEMKFIDKDGLLWKYLDKLIPRGYVKESDRKLVPRRDDKLDLLETQVYELECSLAAIVNRVSELEHKKSLSLEEATKKLFKQVDVNRQRVKDELIKEGKEFLDKIGLKLAEVPNDDKQ